MEIRTFLAGAACGIAAYAAVSAVFFGAPPPDPEAGAGADPGSSTPGGLAVDDRRDVSLEGRRGAGASDASEAVDPAAAAGPGAARSRAGGGAQWRARAYAAFAAEAKDDGWAYYMELAIGQFLASHSMIAQFDLSYIECRTTRCQVGVVGYDESTGASWQRILYDMRQAPWYEFGPIGTASGLEDDGYAIVTDLRRIEPVR